MDRTEKADLIVKSIRRKTCSAKEINMIGAQAKVTSRVWEKNLAIKISAQKKTLHLNYSMQIEQFPFIKPRRNLIVYISINNVSKIVKQLKANNSRLFISKTGLKEKK